MSFKNICNAFRQILSKNLAKVTLLVGIGTAILALYGVCQMAVDFKATSISESQILNNDIAFVPFTKHRFNSKGVVQAGSTDAFSDEEVEDFLNSDAELLVNATYRKFESADDATYVADSLCLGSIDTTIYRSIYQTGNFGTVVTTEDKFKSKFGFDEITYLAKADEYKKCGMYITDYEADKIITKTDYTYEDLLGTTKITAGATRQYVNGIVYTGYLEKFANLIEKYKDTTLILEDDEEDYSYFVKYAKNYLEVSYSFESDFLNEVASVESRSNVIYKSASLTGVYDDDPERESNEIATLTYYYENSWKFSEQYGNNAQFTSSVLNSFFDKNYTVAKRNEILEGKEISLNVVDQLDRPHTYKLGTVTCRDTGGNFFGKQIFEEMLKDVFWYYGAFVENGEGAVNLYNKYKDSGFSIDIENLTGAITLEGIISSYSDLFSYISIILVITAAIIFLYISYDSVKRKTYEIGVFKSFGCSIKNLYQIYLLNFAFEIVVSFIFYFIFVNVFKNSCNSILISALESKTGYVDYFTGLDIFVLTPKVVVIDLIILVSFLLIGFSIPLFKIKHIKPIDIIKTKY